MEIVNTLVGKGIFVRRNEQTFNIAVVLPVMILLVCIPYFYTKAMAWAAGAPGRRKEQGLITISTPGGNTGEGSISFVPTRTIEGYTTPTAQNTVTQTITATNQPTNTIMMQRFSFSWYDPSLGPPNCWDWDAENYICRSLMASGLDWHNYYGRAVACPVEYPFNTIIRVIEPEQLKGDWLCLDRGSEIRGSRLDFLMHGATPGLGWYDGLIAEVILP